MTEDERKLLFDANRIVRKLIGQIDDCGEILEYVDRYSVGLTYGPADVDSFLHIELEGINAVVRDFVTKEKERFEKELAELSFPVPESYQLVKIEGTPDLVEADISEDKYVVIPNLPEEQWEPFREWIKNQTRPIVEREGLNAYHCAWIWDYDKWYKYWKQGKVAPIND